MTNDEKQNQNAIVRASNRGLATRSLGLVNRGLAQSSILFPSPGTVWTNSIGIELVYIPPGEFMMGSENGKEDEKPVHRVKISSGFWMGKYPVTQWQWEAVMGTTVWEHFLHYWGDEPDLDGSYLDGEGVDYPMYYVTWDEAKEFIHRLGEKNDGLKYSLPSEAQWEYAARAGTTGEYYGPLDEIAWYWENSDHMTHPVGQKLPNAFGLYDMLGHVYECCEDRYEPYYYATSPADDPSGPDSGDERVFRGGSWASSGGFFHRSASRISLDATDRDNSVGFRVLARPR